MQHITDRRDSNVDKHGGREKTRNKSTVGENCDEISTNQEQLQNHTHQHELGGKQNPL